MIETTKKIYMIMEYAPNGELFDYIVNKNRFYLKKYYLRLDEKESAKFL